MGASLPPLLNDEFLADFSRGLYCCHYSEQLKSHLALCVPKPFIHFCSCCRKTTCNSDFPPRSFQQPETSCSCQKETTARLYEASFMYRNRANHKAMQEAGTLNCIILQGATEGFIPA